MEKTNAPLNVSSDVLHIPPQTRLSPEEVAKALAHHNRHHPQAQPAGAKKSAPAKKNK